jgi:hypothetical protein
MSLNSMNTAEAAVLHFTDVVAKLQTDVANGLSDAEAERRCAACAAARRVRQLPRAARACGWGAGARCTG